MINFAMPVGYICHKENKDTCHRLN